MLSVNRAKCSVASLRSLVHTSGTCHCCVNALVWLNHCLWQPCTHIFKILLVFVIDEHYRYFFSPGLQVRSPSTVCLGIRKVSTGFLSSGASTHSGRWQTWVPCGHRTEVAGCWQGLFSALEAALSPRSMALFLGLQGSTGRVRLPHTSDLSELLPSSACLFCHIADSSQRNAFAF